jgi:Zn-dependent peptidase ImmA (M78 family)
MDAPVIDMMPLADLGQPRRLAFEIHKQLRAQYGAVPLRSPLHGIASAVGIAGIRECETKAFDGALAIDGNSGAIGIRSGMPSGRRNFTIGHELGHFLIPTHRLRNRNFHCVPKHMRYERGKASEWDRRPGVEKLEVEANEFSAALLVPMPEYRAERAKLARGCDVAHIRPLAQAFDVSQEMMARIYINSSAESAAIVISNNGTVRRIIPKADFPYMGLRAGMEIPRQSLTRDFRAANDEGEVSNAEEVEIHTWLERRDGVSSLCEQVILQRDGWAMTLLSIEQDEEDDEADDSNWNRRNIPRHAPSCR